MLTEERFSRILAILHEEGSVSVQRLVTALGISESTVRRDLNAMDEKGLLVKVRGGAMPNPVNVVPKDERISSRREVHADEKAVIGKAAASLLEPGDFVYLDSGTSVGAMLDFLETEDVVFVTNSISHVLRLSEMGYQVHILGGECKAITESVVGAEAVVNLEKYIFTKGFWGTNGVHAVHGYSTPESREAVVKQKAMEHCAKPYVLADSEKFQMVSNIRFAEFKSAEVITTDRIPETFLQYENVHAVTMEG